MNLIEIGRVIISDYLFLKSLTKYFGPPVHLSDEACQKFLTDLENDPLMSNRFALMANIKTFDIVWQLNFDKFFKYKGKLTVDKFFFKIHPDYLIDYIKWGEACYLYAAEIKDQLIPLQQMTRITIPMKLKDEQYYWVLQEAIPLQLDKDNNMITHIQLYSIIRPFEKKEELPFVGYVWDEGFKHEEWSKAIWKRYFTRQPFILTPELNRIMDLMIQNPHISNGEIADQLGKQKNTIDMQNKQILAKARQSFPNQTFETVRDVAQFLSDLNLMDFKMSDDDG